MGAPAPHLDLSTPASSLRMAKIKSSKKKETVTTSSAARRRKKGPSITVTIQPEIPTHILRVEVRGPLDEKADIDKDHDKVRFSYR